jgi:NADH:ubiquinone oxidoreductase subunit 6 (subunit J)
MYNQITFFVLAVVAIGSSILAVTRLKAWYSFFFFALTLLAVAGIFLGIHAPLLLVPQALAIGVSLVGIIVFAVEAGGLNKFLVAESDLARKFVGTLIVVTLPLQMILLDVQRRRMPGEPLTVLLPKAPAHAPVHIVEELGSLLRNAGLPIALVIFMAVVAILGAKTLFRNKA